MRPLALTLLRPVLAWLLLFSPVACFDPGPATRGLPCTEDSACGSLSCEYGVCGGPVRCEAGAGVGDYCFTFEARELAVGVGVDAIAVGVVDFDPLPDLVVGNGTTQTVAFLRNLGGGELAAPVVSAPLGVSLTEITLGAVDGTEWTDVVATSGTSTLVTLPMRPGGAGTGEIGAMLVLSSTLVGAARPQVAHFVEDSDGLPDIAVLVESGFDVFPQASASAFDPPVHTEVAGSADLQTISSDADLVYVASSTGNSVVVHSRSTGGAFTPKTTIGVGPGPAAFVLDDLDNDTFGDVLAVGTDGKVWLTTGRDTTFTFPRDPNEVYDLGWVPTTLLARNLDDDVEPEFVMSGPAPGGRRDVYLFDNDGEGRPIYGGSLDIDDASSVVVADLDLDGAAEIIIASQDRGMIRVARRAVAPPPPGGEESTSGSTGGVDPTIPDPSSPTDPTLTTSPPETTDPTIPMEETGFEPPCPEEGPLLVGYTCYSYLGWFEMAAPIVDMTLDAVEVDAPTSLVVATQDGLAWNFTGGFGFFAQPELPMFSTTGIPTGIAVGNLEAEPNVPTPVVVVTHDAGFTTHSTVLQAARAEYMIGPSRAPHIGPVVPREGLPPAGGVVVGTDDALHVLEAAAFFSGADTTSTTVAGPVSDLDAVQSFDLDVSLIAAYGGALDIYGTSESFGPYLLVEGLLPGPIDYTTIAIGPMLNGMLVTAGPNGLEVYDLIDDGDPSPTFTDPVAVVADLRLGEFDYAPGQDVVALIDEDGERYLRLYGSNADATLTWLGDLYTPHATAFAIYQYAATTSDLIVAYAPPNDIPFILHLGVL